MFTATADQVVTEQMLKKLWWLNAARWLLHPDRERERRWTIARWVLWPIAAVVSLIYAQALPFLVERAVRPILPQLPSVTDRALLARLEDYFRLMYESLRVYGHLSLARAKVAYWLEELDEQLDTLEFVRQHGSEIDTTVAQIREYHARRESA